MQTTQLIATALLASAMYTPAALAEEGEAESDHSGREARTQIEVAWVPRGLGLAARAEGERDAWLGLEGRFSGDGRWLARGSLGFDVLGASPLDLHIGLFAAGLGSFDEVHGPYEVTTGPAVGTDISVGASFNRLHGYIRWLNGLAAAEEQTWIVETEYRVGYRIVGDWRVFANFLQVKDTGCCRRDGFGFGVDVSF